MASSSSSSSSFLASLSNVPPSVVSFLDSHFASPDDLSSAYSILNRLESERKEMLDRQMSLRSSLTSLSSMASTRMQMSVDSLKDLSKKTHSAKDRTDTFGVEMNPVVEELAKKAEEVKRVERARVYMEKLLMLEGQVADVEDAVTVVAKRGGSSPASLASSATAFQTISNSLTAIADTHPHWKRLRTAVDIRLDRSFAILKPAALGAYRNCVKEIGWPPNLTSKGGPSSSSFVSSFRGNEDEKAGNDLIQRLTGEEKLRFENTFSALCVLQVMENQRRTRQETDLGSVVTDSKTKESVESKELGVRDVLWGIEELVFPIARLAEPHFDRWSERPELVFALGFRVASSHIESIDIALQPLVDRVRLPGVVSAREEWVKGVVAMIVAYLQERLLPWLSQQVRAEVSYGTGASLWLHTVDQALLFDRQMRSLAMGRPVVIGREVTDSVEKFASTNLIGVSSCLEVFAQHSEWLGLWARLELEDAQKKLQTEIQKDRSWRQMDSNDDLGLLVDGLNERDFGIETEFRPMSGAETLFHIMTTSVDRCRPILSGKQKPVFVRAVVAPLARQYCEDLINYVQEVEASTALADIRAMEKVASCASSSRFCEYTLQKWGDEAFFLELRSFQEGSTGTYGADGWEEVRIESEEGGREKSGGESTVSVYGEDDLSKGKISAWTGVMEGSIFDEEIDSFARSYKEWIGRILAAMLRGFQVSCEEYVRNRRKWQEDGTDSNINTNTNNTTIAYTDINSDNNAITSTISVGSSASNEVRERVDENGVPPTFKGEGDGGILDFLGGSRSSTKFLEEMDGQDVSSSFGEPLSLLKSQLNGLQKTLDSELFSELWRRLASSIDRNLMENVVLGGADFSDFGARQFTVDMSALFSLFREYTTKPYNFFKGLRDALVVLLLPLSDANALLLMLSMSGVGSRREEEMGRGREGERERYDESNLAPILWKRNIRRMTAVEVVEILNQRVGIKKL